MYPLKTASLKYTNWGTNEPNNFWEQDCAAVWSFPGRSIREGTWEDFYCESKQYYACELGL